MGRCSSSAIDKNLKYLEITGCQPSQRLIHFIFTCCPSVTSCQGQGMNLEFFFCCTVLAPSPQWATWHLQRPRSDTQGRVHGKLDIETRCPGRVFLVSWICYRAFRSPHVPAPVCRLWERTPLTNSSLLDLFPIGYLRSQGFRVSWKDEVWKGHMTSYLAGELHLALEISADLW